MPNENRTPRMRTVPQAYKEIKEKDPDTAVTVRLIRRLIFTGRVPAVTVGNKTLLNFDLLLRELSCYNDDVVCAS